MAEALTWGVGILGADLKKKLFPGEDHGRMSLCLQKCVRAHAGLGLSV